MTLPAAARASDAALALEVCADAASAATGPYRGHRRITLTCPALAAAGASGRPA